MDKFSQSLIKLSSVSVVAEATILATNYDLKPFLHYVTTHNPSSELPYHSNMHQLLVAVMAHRLYTMSDTFWSKRDKDDGVAESLFLAGLFHDYNHSGGVLEDSANIERALSGLDQAVEELGRRDLEAGGHKLWTGIYARTCAYIRATQWPWQLVTDDGASKGYGYLRDADLLASAMVAGLAAPILGLPEELKNKTGKLFSPQEMAAGQKAFLEGTVLNTLEGQVMWGLVWQSIVDAQQALADELEPR